MAGEDFGSALYYAREAVLATGFLAYAAFAQWRAAHPLSQKAADVAGLVLVVLFTSCILALQLANPPAVRMSAALVVALIVGVSGALAYERIALSVAESNVDRSVPNARDGFRALGVIAGAGGALAWSGISFMSIATQSAHPALVASAWRVIAALVTLAGILVQAADDLPLMATLACSLVLLALLVLALVRGGFLVFSEQSGQGTVPPREEPVPTPKERTQLLARECGLTDREQQVLAALVLTEDKNQQIADNLGISRRQLQTYISRIYQKTGTTTRAGLAMLVNEVPQLR